MSLVAIVGRPNVGKSTLFNRLVGMRQAIVDGTAGVTRDRHYGKCEWCGSVFSVVDTGGYTSNSDDVFESEIRKQVKIAVNEADAVLFLVEAGTGVTDFDDEIADLLRRSGKPVLLVVNKVDTSEKRFDSYQFYSLGLGDPVCISSANGSGTGDMLDELVKLLPSVSEDGENEKHIARIAIVGRPNAGKSSLTNALIGEERNIVTPVAGTTRDSIESYYNKFGHEMMLVDTAGLRKKNKVSEDLEFYSVMRAIRAIEHADVCILMLDATYGMEQQDMSVFNLILKNKKGCVIAVNKWDLIEKHSNTMKEYTAAILRKTAPFSDVPVVFTSVTNKQRILDVLDRAAEVYENYSKRIPTSELNEIMLAEIENCPPPSVKGKFVKIKFITQLPTPCPSFAFFCNLPQYVNEAYKRFLENRLRKHFDFCGCPIQIFMRRK
ncbi:MAG TPA: ribosome biogenesis GTPase Der [Candidatus Coprenecus stercoripullorum]|nr:ribosome biogenesis GTPase Der [Candidatus Coprenecus stercoripullorum]